MTTLTKLVDKSTILLMFPTGQDADSRARTRDTRIPADFRAGTLAICFSTAKWLTNPLWDQLGYFCGRFEFEPLYWCPGLRKA
ncbi:hypothetical protein PoB_007205900 [Plakobranchus ocellatus]|uniref:Transposase n=1 Tax=Plakobranchus ocellatus TaxID=259542 RepID=A0AAV4DNJ7_9GAST|nr:hypothetical protein PoB_007205900 [Plakobranchus ocellatus]